MPGRAPHSRLRPVALLCAGVLALFAGQAGAPTAYAAPTRSTTGTAGTVTPAWQQKVAPKVLHRLETSGTANYVLRFDQHADLTEATGITDWVARGAYVVDQLKANARRSQRDARALLDRSGATYQAYWITNAIEVRGASASLTRQLAQQPGVTEVRTVPKYRVPDPDPMRAQAQADTVEWNVADIGADRVWQQLGDRGEGIVVASVDTGVQFDHPALVNQYRGNNHDGTFNHNYNWYDPSHVCPSPEPCDNIGHGTHTMGTMVGDDGEGNQIGVAPEATWIAAKGCEDEERGCSLGALLASGQWILAPTDLTGDNPRPDLRPNVVNNSWGAATGPETDPYYDDVIAAWTASGIFSVFSNGNEGPACDTAGSPADGDQAYGVGAYDADHAIATFSSRGPGHDGAIRPSISAPGVDVRSAFPENRYAFASGTSMAAPHVSATVALMWSVAPSLIGDVEGTRDLLNQTAVDTEDLSCGGTPQDNNVFGEGRLDAYAAVLASPAGSTGILAGTVTDPQTGDPVVGATLRAVSATYERTTTTGADGTYHMLLTTGVYDVTVTAYGYENASASGVEVAEDTTTTADFQPTPLPMATVTGTVADASGHGWPLYAQLVVGGAPIPAVYTSPDDGHYSVRLPQDSTFTFVVNAEYPGYQVANRTVQTGTADQTVDFAVPVDAASCTAAGYHKRYDGLRETFDGGSLPAGWTKSQDVGDGWEFDDPGGRGNHTGGSGGFASIDSASGARLEDGYLVSPVTDLSGVTDPVVEFASDFLGSRASVQAELSVDGGTTWQELWSRTSTLRGPNLVRAPVPEAAGQPDAQVRFHYVDDVPSNGWWAIDVVLVGSTSCVPDAGGLVVGNVRDSQTGDGVNGATVRSLDGGEQVTSAATVADPSVGDGFYWMFSSLDGTHAFEASDELEQYEARTQQVDVPAGGVARADFALGVGELAVSTSAVQRSVQLGDSRTVRVTVTNTGNAQASYDLSALPAADGADPAAAAGDGAPLRQVRVHDDGGPLTGGEGARVPASVPADGDGGWVQLPDMPRNDLDMFAATHDGKVYVVGGASVGLVHNALVYDIATQTWSPVANSPAAREKPTGGFLGGKLYEVGGWDILAGTTTSTVQVYDPATDSWSDGPDTPVSVAAAAGVVLDGKLYVIGGRTDDPTPSRAVVVFDPVTNAWSRVADYPVPVSWQSCGAVSGVIYCAGGQNEEGKHHLKSAYAYDPAVDHWYRIADMPATVWGGGYTAANGELLVSGGIVGGFLSNAGFAYDPRTDTWSSLPNALWPMHRMASACGFYKIGGSQGTPGIRPWVEQLPGYDDCQSLGDVPWLSATPASGTLAPGESATVSLTLDGSALAQPGKVEADLLVHEDTRSPVDPVHVALHATAPPSWGRVVGQVTGLQRCDLRGAPLAGATVRIDGRSVHAEVTTDERGRYAYWASATENPLWVSASRDGWLDGSERTHVRAGRTTRADLDLRADRPCAQASQDRLRFKVFGNGAQPKRLYLVDDGATAFDYQVSVDVPWLRVSPVAGTVSGDGRARLRVVARGAGLDPGTYRGAVLVTTTDPGAAQLRVPVTLLVR